jgi:ribosome-binding ATPase
MKCASFSRGKVEQCTPKYGKVRQEDGTRFIPVRMLDVAGLVPGASKGLGLGNKFLNDLCGADVLIHIIDVREREGHTRTKHHTNPPSQP